MADAKKTRLIDQLIADAGKTVKDLKARPLIRQIKLNWHSALNSLLEQRAELDNNKLDLIKDVENLGTQDTINEIVEIGLTLKELDEKEEILRAEYEAIFAAPMRDTDLGE